MKIIVSVSHAGRSAGTWYSVEVARRLVARGHEVIYLPRPSEVSVPQKAGLVVIDDLDLEGKSPRKAWKNLRRLSRIIGDIGPDAVLAFGGEDHAFWGLAKSIWARKMAVIRVRVVDPKPPKRHPLAVWLHRRATDLVVTANSSHYSSYQKRLRLPANKLKIIEAGIDPADFADLGDTAFASNDVTIPEDCPLIVTVGRFAPIKGYRVLLAAAAKVRRAHPNAHFFFVGYPFDYTKPDLERWLVETNMRESVTIIDRRLPSLPSLLARCTIGVVSSVGSETVSRSLLEYCACGLAVVASDVGGMSDFLSRGDFGRLVPPDKAGKLAESITEFLDAPDLARACGERGRKYVTDHCTWDQRVDVWEETLYQIVGRVRGESLPLASSDSPTDTPDKAPKA